MKRNWIPVYAATILLLASLGTANAARNELPAETDPAHGSELRQQVERWVDELSGQPTFEKWKNAVIDISALGPGTHSWHVTIVKDGQAAGYMIVHARPEGGYMLGEYGNGSMPMYDAKALYRSMVQLELIPSSFLKLTKQEQQQNPDFTADKLYQGPLQSVWKVTLKKHNGDITYFDAKTGEYLPISGRQWLNAQTESASPSPFGEALQPPAAIEAQRMNRSFDPYIRFPWLTKPPMQGDLASGLRKQLDEQRKIWFSSEPYGPSMRYVWAVIGYQIWNNGQMYIAVDQNGSRFVPLGALEGTGHFYN